MKLIDTLHSNLIKYPLAANNKVDAIKELLALLADQGAIQDPENVLKAVLERENIMTTGIGDGVAIPHCKTAEAIRFVIALGIHPGGIDFDSLDKKPAHLIFLLVGPDNEPGMHIRLLSRISRIISKAPVRDRILACSKAEEVYQLINEEENNAFEVKTP